MKIKPYTKICAICSKAPQSGNNKPHSLHKTKKIVKPNIVKMSGVYVCARCKKTITRKYPHLI